MDANRIITNRTLKLVKTIQTVVMGTRLSVIMMTITPNQCKSTEVRKLYINLWKLC